jgi:signal transduction histidine kinase
VRLLLANHQADAAQVQLEQLEEAARQELLDVRQAILGLRLTADSQVDLPAALRGTAAHFSQLSGIPVRVDILAETPRFTWRRSGLGCAHCSEALSTSTSTPPPCRLSNCVGRGGPEVTVADDGAGFDIQQGASANSEHFGLESMRQRARAIGADFKVESAPGNGTRVVISLAPGEDE